MAQMVNVCPLNFQEITIAPGQYTPADFYAACQSAVGNTYRWVIISTYQLTSADSGGIMTYIMAYGSANAGNASVIINTGSEYYGGMQRVSGNSTSTILREITADMKFYAHTWGE